MGHFFLKPTLCFPDNYLSLGSNVWLFQTELNYLPASKINTNTEHSLLSYLKKAKSQTKKKHAKQSGVYLGFNYE